MDETQHFRLAGTTTVEKIDYDHVDGHNVIYWEDIELVFPGVKHVKCNDVTVKPLRDSNRNRIIPHCIKYYPGVALDVVLSSSGQNVSTAAGRNRDDARDSTEGDVIESLQIEQLPHASLERGSRTSLSFKQIVTLSKKATIESEIEQQLVSSLPSDLQVQVRSSTNVRKSLIQVIRDGQVQRSNEQFAACLQELDHKMVEIKDMAFKITDLIYKNNELASKNNEMGSRIIDLISENKDQLAQIGRLQNNLAFKQDEIKLLQIQALDRLALLQKSVQALLTQTYELHEYPIPRLFIVLPQDTSPWNPLDLLANKFRLYFLCECGEHTKSTNSKIPHHIHLAKHEGYDIARPNEFFQRYGTYVLTILKMLKYSITAAGISAPALSQLIRVDALDQATVCLKSLTNIIEPGMNQVISCIEKISSDNGEAVVEVGQQMENNEALEGADLRQLETFLKNKDNNRVLGNLYRTVTSEGHVKWVCVDHYRENYHEKVAEAFRSAAKALQGSFDENTGRVEVRLVSRVQAEQFYLALEKARSVYELMVTIYWETSQSDFKKLRDTLAITNVGVLELHLIQQDVPTRDILNRNQRFDPVLDIMRHRSIQSFTIRGPCDFIKRSSLLSHNYQFSNLRHLDISLDQLKDDIPGVKCLIFKSTALSSFTLGSSAGSILVPLGVIAGDLVFPPTLRHLDVPLYQFRDDIPGVKRLIANVSNLSSLALRTGALGNDNGYVLQVYNAITEHRTYSINFKDWNLCLPPPPPKQSYQSFAHRYMEHLLKLHCEVTERVELNKRWLNLDGGKYDELFVHAAANTTKTDSAPNGLWVRQSYQLSDPFINNISGVVARSELNNIEIWMREDEGRVRILESIQWKHLRRLWIEMKSETFEASVMRVLVDGVKKTSGKVRLEDFAFYSDTKYFPLTLSQGDLLRDFVSSIPLKYLVLQVNITFEQTLSLCGSINVPLERLKLWTDGFDSAKVEAILYELQHTTSLTSLILHRANITDEQKRQMKAKGISLQGQWGDWY